MATMQFDLVSPERSLASLQASAVQIPATDGDMTAMPDHAPTITTLRPGLLRVESPSGNTDYVVTGGFAEIGSDGLSVLAEKAIPAADMTRADLDALIAEARAAHDAARDAKDGSLVDAAAKLLADMEALGSHIIL